MGERGSADFPKVAYAASGKCTTNLLFCTTFWEMKKPNSSQAVFNLKYIFYWNLKYMSSSRLLLADCI